MQGLKEDTPLRNLQPYQIELLRNHLKKYQATLTTRNGYHILKDAANLSFGLGGDVDVAMTKSIASKAYKRQQAKLAAPAKPQVIIPQSLLH